MKRYLLVLLVFMVLTPWAALSLDLDALRGIWQSATLVKEEDEISGVSLALAFMVSEERGDTAAVTLKGYALYKGRAGAYFNLSTEALCRIQGDTLSLLPLRPYAVEVTEDGIEYADTLTQPERDDYKAVFNQLAAGMARDINNPTYTTFYFDITVQGLEPERFTGTLIRPFASAPTPFIKLL